MQRRDFLRHVSTASAVLGSASHATADTPKPRIKVGQIGVGHAHASKLARLPPVAGLRGRRHRRAGRGAAQAGRDAAGLPRPDVDDAGAAARTRRACRRCWSRRASRDLLDNAEACVAAGKHVHIDKPAGESLPQFRRILDVGGEAEAARADGLHVPLQPGGRAAPRVPQEGLARRGVRGPRGHEQGRRRRPSASELAEYPRRDDVRAGLPRPRPGHRRARQADRGRRRSPSTRRRLDDKLLDNMLAVLHATRRRRRR